MAYATSTIIAVAAVASAVAAAAGTGISMYAASEQADAQAKAAKRQADAERAAGEARRAQVEDDAERKRKTMYSRQAASGALIGQGSLLESEMAFASDAEYSAQLAEFPHQLAESNYDYESRLLNASASSLRTRAPIMAGVTGGSSLASSYSALSGLRFK